MERSPPADFVLGRPEQNVPSASSKAIFPFACQRVLIPQSAPALRTYSKISVADVLEQENAPPRPASIAPRATDFYPSMSSRCAE
jgi:hypothetical protein